MICLERSVNINLARVQSVTISFELILHEEFSCLQLNEDDSLHTTTVSQRVKEGQTKEPPPLYEDYEELVHAVILDRIFMNR